MELRERHSLTHEKGRRSSSSRSSSETRKCNGKGNRCLRWLSSSATHLDDAKLDQYESCKSRDRLARKEYCSGSSSLVSKFIFQNLQNWPAAIAVYLDPAESIAFVFVHANCANAAAHALPNSQQQQQQTRDALVFLRSSLLVCSLVRSFWTNCLSLSAGQ